MLLGTDDYGMGGIGVLSVETPNLQTDPCGTAAELAAKGITPNSPIAAFAAIAQQAQALCAQRRASSPIPLGSSGPSLSLRRRPGVADPNRVALTPCESYDRARAAGQAPVIVSALAAKCEAFRAAGGVASGELYGDEEKAAGIPPLVVAAGVVGVALLAFKLIKG